MEGVGSILVVDCVADRAGDAPHAAAPALHARRSPRRARKRRVAAVDRDETLGLVLCDAVLPDRAASRVLATPARSPRRSSPR